MGMSGESKDDRCCGTGTVLMYDDGHIGENKHKQHPQEMALGKRPHVPNLCGNCHREVDVTWKACPYCGTRLQETMGMAIGGEGGAS